MSGSETSVGVSGGDFLLEAGPAEFLLLLVFQKAVPESPEFWNFGNCGNFGNFGNFWILGIFEFLNFWIFLLGVETLLPVCCDEAMLTTLSVVNASIASLPVSGLLRLSGCMCHIEFCYIAHAANSMLLISGENRPFSHEG